MDDRSDARLAHIFDDVVASLRQVIRERRVTHEEYRRAVEFMCGVAESGEVPLLMDVFLEATVVDNADKAGTELSVEGPYYLGDAPVLGAPYVLPQRSEERFSPWLAGAISYTALILLLDYTEFR